MNAGVFINDEQILLAENMFREWTVDIKPFFKNGENELRLVFKSPIVEGIKKYDAQGYEIPVSDNDLAEIGKVEGNKKVSIYTRKASYHFGWDWGPRLVTSGIWRPVYLNAWDRAKIKNLQIIQNEVTEENASLTAVFEINAVKKGQAVISIENKEGFFSNNYFDLLPGESAVIQSQTNISEEKLNEVFSIRTLDSAF